MGSLDTMVIRGVRRLHRTGRQAGSGGVAFFVQLSAIRHQQSARRWSL